MCIIGPESDSLSHDERSEERDWLFDGISGVHIGLLMAGSYVTV